MLRWFTVADENVSWIFFKISSVIFLMLENGVSYFEIFAILQRSFI